MYIHYNQKTDYLEVFYEKVPNIGELQKNGIIIYTSKTSKKKKIIGYGIESISKKIKRLQIFSPGEKLSILIKINRIKHGLTQQQIAEKMGIKLLPYQRLESGTINPTLNTILKIKETLPEIELSLVA